MPSAGALLCLASAAAFGAMGIFGKLAYDEGATVGTLLAFRFALAAALFWLLAAATGRARELRAVPRRDVAIALALGAVGYSAQAGGYFAALERLDASLLSLLLYTFPAMVTVAAIALGRERASWRRAVALVLVSAGLVLVLAGRGRGRARPARRRARARRGGGLQRVHPQLRGSGGADGAGAAQHAGVHRRGDHPHDRVAGHRQPRPGRRERRRATAGWRASR